MTEPKSKPIKTAIGMIRSGQLIAPRTRADLGHIPAGSRQHPRAGAPKAFPIAAREHGIHPEDRDPACRVVGAHPGHQPSADHPSVEIHPGMMHRDGSGKFQGGITSTQANHPVDDELMITAPGKITATAPPVVGQRNRTLTGGIEGLRDARLPSQIKR